MTVVVPNALALATIADGSAIVASDHRNNYSAVQVGVNGLIAMFTVAATKGDLIVSAGGGSFDHLPVGSNTQVMTADSTQPLGVKWAAAASGLAVLADLTLGGSQATIDTNTILAGNLPATYSHLKVVIVSREDTATTLDTILMRINNDSAANYDWQYLRGAGASASAAEGLGQTSLTVGLEPGSSVTAGVFSATEILIPQYTGTVANKTITCASNGKTGTASGNIFHQTSSGFWRSSAAITRLTFLPASGNFIAGTRITVYGMV